MLGVWVSASTAGVVMQPVSRVGGYTTGIVSATQQLRNVCLQSPFQRNAPAPLSICHGTNAPRSYVGPTPSSTSPPPSSSLTSLLSPPPLPSLPSSLSLHYPQNWELPGCSKIKVSYVSPTPYSASLPSPSSSPSPLSLCLCPCLSVSVSVSVFLSISLSVCLSLSRSCFTFPRALPFSFV